MKGDLKMKPEDISVDLKMFEKPGSKLKAFADVTLPFEGDGFVKLCGFSIIQADAEQPRIAPPARKGGERYFDTVMLIGKVRAVVQDAILDEYKRAIRSQEPS
jgi:DNA-binding cell septation regulator SpoVG